MLLDKAIDAAQEFSNAFDPRILPIEIPIRRSGEKAVETRGVGAIARDHFIGTNNVAQALRHLRAVFDNHALREEALDGFVVGDEAQVAHELAPKARINKVQDGVLYATDVLIDGEPVLRGFRIERSVVVVRVSVAVKIPGGIDERVHGIGFATRRAPALGASRVNKLW